MTITVNDACAPLRRIIVDAFDSAAQAVVDTPSSLTADSEFINCIGSFLLLLNDPPSNIDTFARPMAEALNRRLGSQAITVVDQALRLTAPHLHEIGLSQPDVQRVGRFITHQFMLVRRFLHNSAV